MGLSSNLFRGNPALEACAIEHRAHVTRGASGDHVAKIQFALFSLDGLVIDRSELVARKYGPSTAAAVLAFKRKRDVVNRSYQNTADDIVGKMTIAALDKEMQQHERLPRPPGDCVLSPTIPTSAISTRAAAPRRQASALGGRSSTTAPATPLSGAVRVFFAVTSRSAAETRYPLSKEIEVARDLLFAHGITLMIEIRDGFADTIPFPSRIVSSFGNPADNVDELRTASENLRPGLPGILRVIVCPMAGGNAGETFRGRSVGRRVVPPFVCLNSEVIDLSHATLIHEMIHASKTGPIPHDPEPSSVFFAFGTEKPGGIDRTFLKPEHAKTLSTMSSRL